MGGQEQVISVLRSIQLLVHSLGIRAGGKRPKPVGVSRLEPEFEKRFKVPLQFSALFGPAKGAEGALTFVLTFPSLFKVTTNGLEPCVRCLSKEEAACATEKNGDGGTCETNNNEESPQVQAMEVEEENENASSAASSAAADEDLLQDDGVMFESSDPEIYLKQPTVDDLPKGAGTACNETGNGSWLLPAPPVAIPANLRRFELGAAEKFTGLALNLIAEEKPGGQLEEKFAEF